MSMRSSGGSRTSRYDKVRRGYHVCVLKILISVSIVLTLFCKQREPAGSLIYKLSR